MFPDVDPIPLPAPVWLFKILEMLTVTLHFLAMQLLVGGLLVGTIWAIWGRRRSDFRMLDGAGAIAERLPIIMIYVINLGIPPLLFAQVLYGRALYTSSVLIGAFWISVVLLLMLGYTLLYVMAARAKGRERWGGIGAAALVIVAAIGMIYSSNMALMIRPQDWPGLYEADPCGLHLNHSDPTVGPRWLFMMLGGLSVGGAGLMVLGLKKQFHVESGEFVRRWGARLVASGIVAQGLVGIGVLAGQPSEVKAALRESGFYIFCFVLWGVLALVLAAVGAVAQGKAAAPHWRWPALAGSLVFLEVAVMAIVRGGIRDAALRVHGYVFERQVAANWWVVGLFLASFVAGLGALAWLATVAFRAKGVEENYA